MWARPSGLRTFEATFAFTFITARRLVVFPRETLSIGFRVLVSRHPAIQTTGLLTFAPAGLSPAEHASLRWTHTRTCRFPASGSSRESFARVGVKAVDDPCRWKRMALEDRVEAGPVERASSTMPSRQPFLPQHHDLAGEPSYASRVARYAVVGIVASQHLGQMGMLIAQGSMPIVSAPLAYCRQRPRVPAFGRHLPHPVHPLL